MSDVREISEETFKEINRIMLCKKCRANEYKDNSVIFHSPIICWGFADQPQCKHLKDCLMDYREDFLKAGKKRKFNNLLMKVLEPKQ